MPPSSILEEVHIRLEESELLLKETKKSIERCEAILSLSTQHLLNIPMRVGRESPRE